MVKNLLQCRRPGFDPWVGKIPWRRPWQLTLVFLPGDSPWTEEPGGLQSMGSAESDTTEWLWQSRAWNPELRTSRPVLLASRFTGYCHSFYYWFPKWFLSLSSKLEATYSLRHHLFDPWSVTIFPELVNYYYFLVEVFLKHLHFWLSLEMWTIWQHWV